jgi:hypothetical protein
MFLARGVAFRPDEPPLAQPKPLELKWNELPSMNIGHHVEVLRTRGAWGRTLGTVIGVVAGLGGGGYAAAHTDSAGAAVGVLVAVISTSSTPHGTVTPAVTNSMLGNQPLQHLTRL